MVSAVEDNVTVVKPIRTSKGVYLPNYNRVTKVNKDPRRINPHKKDFSDNRNQAPRRYVNVVRAPLMGPVYDWDTQNKSFIDVHKQLKLLGIKNNAFHLIYQSNHFQSM